MKKHFMKLLGLVTGIVACVPMGLAQFTAAATNYDSRDVDRDSTVDISDNIELRYYLNGNQRASNLYDIDVDGNNIVDWADTSCILAGIVNLNYSCQVDGSNASFLAGIRTSAVTNSSASQNYKKHIYSNNTTSSYTLSISSNNLSNTMSMNSNPEGIIGPDTRTQDYMGGMVYLTNGQTGFIVGDHVIATAARCVYDSTWNSYQIRLYNNDGSPSNTYLNPVEAHIPANYYNGNHNSKYDYALIVVQEDLSNYYHFNLGLPYGMYNNSNFSEYAIYTTGFSAMVPGGGSNSNPKNMYTGIGEIVTPSTIDNTVICHSADITNGNFGGPVYVKETCTTGNTSTEINTVISICSDTHTLSTPYYNCGATMNPIMLKFYLSNPQVINLFQNMS